MKESLASMWFAVCRLRAEGKALVASGGLPLEKILEERLFQEADKRIDRDIQERKEVIIWPQKQK